MNLKKGDRVMLVWGCCAFIRSHIGWTGEVEGAKPVNLAFCSQCGVGAENITLALVTIYDQGWVPQSWLKKLDDAPAAQLNKEVEHANA